MAEKATKVFHIPGRFVAGEPLEDHTVESVTEADRLVATGAFARTQAEANAGAFNTGEATPATDDNVKQAKQVTTEPAAPAAEPSEE